MKVAIVSTFDTFFDRVNLLKDFYQKKGYEVCVITSDFSHRLKEKYINEQADVQISVKEYQKNLSLNRLRSHFLFAKDVKEYLGTFKPDLIHCIIPCNSLCQTMSEYKKLNSCRLIFDLNDLWPESLPVGKIKKVFPFTLWKDKRDRYINDADLILTECNYFREILRKEQDSKWHTLFYSKKDLPIESSPQWHSDSLHFCYLGSINNIIDIDIIENFLEKCAQQKPTFLHLIGGGEKKEFLIQSLQKKSISVIDHGYIFDQKKKQDIFDECRYGLNVMKNTVIVGLTMKSLDYMCGGLPIINTIQGDTADFCKTRGIGYNIDSNNIQEIVDRIVMENEEENKKSREAIKSLYLSTFTQEAFNSELERLDL